MALDFIKELGWEILFFIVIACFKHIKAIYFQAREKVKEVVKKPVEFNETISNRPGQVVPISNSKEYIPKSLTNTQLRGLQYAQQAQAQLLQQELYQQQRLQLLEQQHRR